MIAGYILGSALGLAIFWGVRIAIARREDAWVREWAALKLRQLEDRRPPT